MAGGIDWFRWHHGSVTDPKFGLVAKKAGARVGDVIAVWAYLLESASANEDRGTVGEIDDEAVEFLLGLDEGMAFRILDAMTQRGLLEAGGRVAAWEKRQPKREDDTAAERKRRQREREHELRAAPIVTEPESQHVTQSHAEVTHGHDREEKRREENSPSLRSGEVSGIALRSKPPAPSPPPPFDGENAEALNGKHVVTLAPNFDLPQDWGEDAERLGWKPAEILVQAEKFRQYWTVGKGQGTRRNVKGWRQTWSNWLAKAAEYRR